MPSAPPNKLPNASGRCVPKTKAGQTLEGQAWTNTRSCSSSRSSSSSSPSTGSSVEMREAWYIEHDLRTGNEQREADYQLELLRISLVKHAAFAAYYATRDGGEGGVPANAN